MRNTLKVFGVSLAIALATAIAIPTVATAAGDSGHVLPGPGHPHATASGGASGTPSATPAQPAQSHALGSKVVTPSNWSLVPSPSVGSAFNSLNGVSCVTAKFCMAAGNQNSGAVEQTLTELWNGTTWTIVNSPSPSTAGENELDGISCFTAAFCVAVGFTNNGEEDQTLIEQWNGVSWSVVSSPNAATNHDNDLYGVSCLSNAFCEAVGHSSNGSNDQTLIEQWNGASWSIVASPNAAPTGYNDLGGVSCVTTALCQAVGDAEGSTGADTLILQWNGSAWTITPSPNEPGATDSYLNGVSCAGTSMCMAVGEADLATNGPANIVEQWNGSTWSVDPAPDANVQFGDLLLGVDCFGPTSCVASGYVNTIDNTDNTFATEMLTWNGSTWALVNVPEPPATTQDDQINGVACVAGFVCVGVGYATYGSSTNSQTMTMSAPVARPGYAEVASDGGIFNFGGAGFYGSLGSLKLNKPIVGMAVTPDGGGYWLVASDGGVFAEGDAAFYGSLGSIVLNKPIVGMASTPNGQGYWLVASDGGIFAFGNAGFFGSEGGTPLNKPVVGMAATPDGQGYWLVASDGGIFTKGDAAFFGSEGGTVLNSPVVGMAATPDGQGYWLVASDGGIFTKGDANFYGSEGGTVLNKPIVGMAPSPDGNGYWLVASDGGIFAKGDAGFAGSQGGKPLNKPVVGIGA